MHMPKYEISWLFLILSICKISLGILKLIQVEHKHICQLKTTTWLARDHFSAQACRHICVDNPKIVMPPANSIYWMQEHKNFTNSSHLMMSRTTEPFWVGPCSSASSTVLVLYLCAYNSSRLQGYWWLCHLKTWMVTSSSLGVDYCYHKLLLTAN